MSNPSPRTGRTVLVVLAATLVAVASVPWLVVDALPHTLATRWDVDGTPTSSSDRALLAAVTLAMVAAAVAGLVALAAVRRPTAPQRLPLLGGAAALLGAIVALPVLMILVANRGADDWREVPGPAGWQIVAVIGLSLAAGGLAAWAASGLPSVDDRPAPTAPLDAPDTAEVSWSRSLAVGWLLLPSLGTVVLGLVLAVAGHGWLGAFLVVVGLATTAVGRIEVVADRRGLSVAYGPFRWPRTRVPLERIDGAAAIDVVPSDWGGWGYRGSVALFRQAAVVLRAGPGIRLDLTDGRRFVVTVDDAETAAAVLNRELIRTGRS